MVFSPSPVLTKDDIASVVPQPGNSKPPPVSLLGSKGTSKAFALEDHTHEVLVQRVVMMTDNLGVVTWTFAQPITCTKGTVPPVAAVPEDSGSPIAVQITGRTFTSTPDADVHTAVTVRAQRSQLLPATILSLAALVKFDVFGLAAGNVKLNMWASPPTQ